MKNKLLLLTSAYIIFSTNIKAQITLDKEITPWGGMGESFYVAQISSSETKYVFIDTLSNTFSLYNLDFTPYIENIVVPEPFIQGTTFMQPIYITRTLFDCDSSNIEYAYQSSTNIQKPFRVVRTDGTILFQRDSSNGVFCIGSCLGLSDFVRPIRNTSEGTKLFLQHYETGSGKRHIYVYSLCDELPMSVFDFSIFNTAFVDVYPNPSSDLVMFKVNPPDNLESEYEIVISNVNGGVLKRGKVNKTDYTYTFKVNDISSGMYYYSLFSDLKPYQSGKFIITK